MKSSEIINHILQNPLYGNLKAARECKEALLMLGKSRSLLIKFAYQRQNTLFIAVAHPLALQELKNDNIINQIKTLLNKYIVFKEDTSLKRVDEVKIFITKLSKFKKASEIKSRILERSDGEFLNLAKDRVIYELFEKLRVSINANR
ncbi:hypothetical protein [Campylobacter fetus]|uniref:hypothetical protein n=1 Tax=Campylobacter fetus TaxID=196 RepID=UPI000530D4A6|nr:hypothetical protein [Campylobacter fetus]KGT36431.1 hypothetical protein KU70_05875 [Campylobacter fetus]MBD3866128.1 hypothetical protein [Campylobacter fetus]